MRRGEKIAYAVLFALHIAPVVLISLEQAASGISSFSSFALWFKAIGGSDFEIFASTELDPDGSAPCFTNFQQRLPVTY